MTIFNMSLLRTIATTTLCTLAYAQADLVKLTNGDSLSGNINKIGKNSLSLSSPLTPVIIDIKSDKVSFISFDKPTKQPVQHRELVTLINGDKLPCKILSFQKETLKLSTWYGGEFSVARNNIQSIEFGLIEDKIIYKGSEPPEKWTLTKGTWKYSKSNGYSCQGSGALARKIDFPDAFSVNFNISWRNTPNFVLRFCADNTKALTKQNSYEFSFNNAGMAIKHVFDKKMAVTLATSHLRPSKIKDKKLQVEIQINRKTGEGTLYLDGIKAEHWIDTLSSPQGKFIILNNRTDSNGTSIKDLIVKQSRPRIFRIPSKNKLQPKLDQLVDSEGDLLTGTITSIDTINGQRIISMKMPNATDPIQVPDHRMSMIVFSHKGDKPLSSKKTPYVVHLLGKGYIHLSSPTLNGEKISAKHPILGKVTLDTEVVKNISFECYHKIKIGKTTIKTSSLKKAVSKAFDTFIKKTGKKDDKLAKNPSVIQFTNGDKLSGFVQNTTSDKNLTVSSDNLTHPIYFPLQNIVTIKLDNWKSRKTPKTLARIDFTSRFGEPNRSDSMQGSLEELNDKQITLKTWYAGTVHIRRNMVKSLKIITHTPGSYYGPNNLKEWTLCDDEPTWIFDKMTLISRDNQGGIGKDVGLREKSHISFDAKWKKNMQFRVQLFSNDVSSTSPDAYYDINFSQRYAYIRTYGKVKKGKAGMGRFRGGGQWIPMKNLPSERKAHIDIYADRKRGIFNIYLDGKKACTLQSQSPDPVDLGKGITFVAEHNAPLEISNIIITSWNGKNLPNKNRFLKTKDNPKDPKKEIQAPSHPIQHIDLKNGDSISGNIDKIEKGVMFMKTKFTPVKIPLKYVNSFKLEGKLEEPKKYQGDVQAWFHTGGHITLQLAKISNGKISGFSQIFGDITVDLDAINQLDFHIYDDDINALRKNTSSISSSTSEDPFR